MKNLNKSTKKLLNQHLKHELRWSWWRRTRRMVTFELFFTRLEHSDKYKSLPNIEKSFDDFAYEMEAKNGKYDQFIYIDLWSMYSFLSKLS